MQELVEQLNKMFKRYFKTLDLTNKEEVNKYITIYDKLQEMMELLKTENIQGDLLQEKIEENALEEEITNVFGPYILSYLAIRNLH